jgi:hypothetical protein
MDEKQLQIMRSDHQAALLRARADAELARDHQPRKSFWAAYTDPRTGQLIAPVPDPAEGSQPPTAEDLAPLSRDEAMAAMGTQGAGHFGEYRADPAERARLVRGEGEFAPPEAQVFDRTFVRGNASDFAGAGHEDPRSRSAMFSGGLRK